MPPHDCIQGDRIKRVEGQVDHAAEEATKADKGLGAVLEALKGVMARMDSHSKKYDTFIEEFKEHKKEADAEGGWHDRIKKIESIMLDERNGLVNQVEIIKKGYWKVALITGISVGIILKISFAMMDKFIPLLMKIVSTKVY